ncbi:OmpH family outer membrane protein [Zhouia sp. PK063]|uniref:OmpH family outer membrane protein n=1 Tax=Zhouia sp. PK063 TaxID=3373602 RepID=UPI0037A46285
MKKIILGLLCVASFMSCQQSKIAFVDNTKLINDYQEKIDMEAKYQHKIDVFDKKRDSIGKTLQAEAQDFSEKSKSMSQTAAQSRYNELMQKRQTAGQQLQQEQQQLAQESQTEIDSLVSKVRKFVKDYGKKNGYTYILGANDAGSVMYGEESKDITEEIVKELNAAYKK